MSKPITIKDTCDWIAVVLSGGRLSAAPELHLIPETATARFLREALGQDAPRIDPTIRRKAVLVLLEEEQRRRAERRSVSAEEKQ